MSTKPPFKKSILTREIPSMAQLAADNASKESTAETHEDRELDWQGIDPNEFALALKIGIRADEFSWKYGKFHEDPVKVQMDMLCVHKYNCRLSLLQFLMSSDADFANDYAAIRRFLHRGSGTLPQHAIDRLRFREKTS